MNIKSLESVEGLSLKGMIPLHEEDQIKFNEKRYAYVILSNSDCESIYPSLKLQQKMSFKITEIEVESHEEIGSYDEEYDQLEDATIQQKDYLLALPVPMGKFADQWEVIGGQGQRDGSLAELSQTFQLQFKNMNAAVVGIIKLFDNVSVCDQSDKVNVTEKVHTLLLSGLFYGKFQVLVRGQVGFNPDYGCVMKVIVRSMDHQVSTNVLQMIS
mmetsp:Transcript_8463/g.14209  ORF Transcript_8463/g.14209 Transcript_8463/m.14209 type:complete len:214 (-) Transcript_8463:58-699(-)